MVAACQDTGPSPRSRAQWGWLVGACVASTTAVLGHFMLLLLPMPQPHTFLPSQSFPCLLLPFPGPHHQTPGDVAEGEAQRPPQAHAERGAA